MVMLAIGIASGVYRGYRQETRRIDDFSGRQDSKTNFLVSRVNHHIGNLIAKNQNVSLIFILKNRLDKELEIIKCSALTPCCSSVVSAPRTVPQGATASLEINLKAGASTGLKKAEFLVETLAYKREVVLLSVDASFLSEREIVFVGGMKKMPLNQGGEQRFQFTSRAEKVVKGAIPNKL
jgi:hypothetical protein